ncbi:MAG: aldolase [Chloroflexi bacterium]|nr:aldolase [Chloroflexota bacterium]
MSVLDVGGGCSQMAERINTAVLRDGAATHTLLEAGRLNKVIELIEQGRTAFGTFLPATSIPDAVWASTSPYDFVVFELEHDTFDLAGLRLSLQYLLDRRRIAAGALAGRLGPDVVPFVRVPRNGRERDDWVIKQVLDIGVYGIVFPMVNTPEDVRHILAAMRYPQAQSAADQAPAGRRGYSPENAERYWGLDGQTYFDRADVWPLDPQGELLPVLQCETVEGVENLPAICRDVRTPGLILISTGDLSVSMGYRGAYTLEVEAMVQRAALVCEEYGVPYGTPHVTPENIEERAAAGFHLLMCGAQRDVSTLLRGLASAGRTVARA